MSPSSYVSFRRCSVSANPLLIRSGCPEDDDALEVAHIVRRAACHLGHFRRSASCVRRRAKMFDQHRHRSRRSAAETMRRTECCSVGLCARFRETTVVWLQGSVGATC